MKKLLTYGLILCMMVTMCAGCSKKDTAKNNSTKSSDKKVSGLDFKPSDYVTLGKYKGVKGYNITCKVSDEELKKEIDSQLEDAATYSDIKDRGAKKGDMITIDYTASVDGKEVEDCKETDYEITLGNEDFNKTIEKKLIGTKVKDTIQVDMKIPEDLSSTNAGDKASFTVTVKKLQEEKIPEYNLDFVKKNTDYETIKDYEASVKDDLLSSKEEDYHTRVVSQILQTVVSDSEFKKDYPEKLYKKSEDDFYEGVDYYAQMFGMDRKSYLSDFAGMDDKAVKEAILQTLHEKLVVYAIAEKEDKYLTDKELQEYEEAIVKQYGYKDVKELESDYDKDTIRYEAIYDHVADFLLNNAKLENISEEDFEKKEQEQASQEATSDEETSEEEDSSEETTTEK